MFRKVSGRVCGTKSVTMRIHHPLGHKEFMQHDTKAIKKTVLLADTFSAPLLLSLWLKILLWHIFASRFLRTERSNRFRCSARLCLGERREQPANERGGTHCSHRWRSEGRWQKQRRLHRLRRVRQIAGVERLSVASRPRRQQGISREAGGWADLQPKLRTF